MKDSTAKHMSKVFTGEYLAHMRYKDINLLCFMYLGSKAFGDTTKKFLINRWSEMTDDKIIDDLMSVNNSDIYNHPFPYGRKYPSIYWISDFNCIDIVPIDIIKQLPMSVWNEPMLDTHGGNDMTKFEVIPIRDFLLRKRKTPQEIKDYLKEIIMKDFSSFKKITTEDCVNAICELLYHQGKKGDSLNPKNWKRLSKSGSDIIVREFINKVTGEKLTVSETRGQIFRIVEDKDIPAKPLTPVSEQITVKDVMDWADEFEEDPIIDGPINMNEKDEEEFMKSLPKKFIEKGDLFDGWDLGSLKYEEESDNDELVKLWVDFLNLKGYKNGYIQMLDEVKGIVTPVDDLSEYFPFVYKFDFATVYSIEKLDSWEFRDSTEEIKEEGYESVTISKGTRIGAIDAGDNEIKSIIVFTSDSVFYNNGDGMTNDGISYFKVGKKAHYVPAQEPIDVLGDWSGIGLYDEDEQKKIELSAKKYKLDHLLLSM